MRPIIDAHLDLAWNALHWNRDLTLPLEQLRSAESNMTDHPARGHGTVSLLELQRADVRVCMGTLLARAKPQPERAAAFDRRDVDFATQSHAFGGYGNEQSPLGIDSIADLQALSPLLESRGYASADVDRLLSGNLLKLLLSSLPSAES